MEGWRNLGVALHAEVGQYVAGMQLATRETKEWARSTVAAGEEAVVAFHKQSSGLDAFAGKMNRRVTLPVLAAGAASVKFAYDFDKAFSTIESRGFASAGAIHGIKDEVLKLSDSTGVDSTKLANTLVAIYRDGHRGADAMNVLTAAAKGAELGLGDAADVAKTLDSATHAYVGSGLTAARVLDIITAAASRSNADVSQFGPALGQLIPVAASLHIGFDQVAGSLAFLSKNAGGNVQVAASQLRFILQQLDNVTPKAAKGLHSVGMTAASLRADITDRGLITALSDLRDKLGGNDQALLKVFPNARAVSGIIALLANGGRGAAKDIGAVTDSVGSADTAIVKLNKTDTQKLRRDFTQLKNDGIRLGDALIPIITKVVGGITWLTGSTLGKWSAGLIIGALALAGPLLKIVSLYEKISAASRRAGDAKAFRQGLAGLNDDAVVAEGGVGGLVAALGPSGLLAVAAPVAVGVGLLGVAFGALGDSASATKANVKSMVDAIAAGEAPTEAFNRKLSATLSGASGGFSLRISGNDFRSAIKEIGISAGRLSAVLLGPKKGLQDLFDEIATKHPNADYVVETLNQMWTAGQRAKEQGKVISSVNKQLGLTNDKTAGSTKDLANQIDALTGSDRGNVTASNDAAAASLGLWKQSRDRFDAAEKERIALEAVGSAQSDLAKAQAADARNGPQMVAARQQIVTAERSLAAAQRDGVDAQRALTQARADAVRNLRDLHNGLTDATLSERGAVLSLAQAKDQLANLPLDSTDLQRQQAQLAVDQAQQSLIEAGQAKGDAATALAQGPIQNAINIAAAEQRVTDSVNAVADARQGVVTATQAYKQAQLDADQAVKDSQDKLRAAQLAYAQTLDDEAASHLKLTDAVIAGYQRVADSMGVNNPLRRNLLAYIQGLLLVKKLQDGTGTGPGTANSSPSTGVQVPTRNPDTGPTVPGQPIPSGAPGYPPDPGGPFGTGQDPSSPKPKAKMLGSTTLYAPRAWPVTTTADAPAAGHRPAPATPSAAGTGNTTNIYTSDAKRYFDNSVFDS